MTTTMNNNNNNNNTTNNRAAALLLLLLGGGVSLLRECVMFSFRFEFSKTKRERDARDFCDAFASLLLAREKREF